MISIHLNSEEVSAMSPEGEGSGRSKERGERKFAPNLILTRSEAPLGCTIKWKY